MYWAAWPLEMGSLIHCLAPFDIGLPHRFLQEFIGAEQALAMLGQGNQGLMDIVQEALTALEVAMQDAGQRARHILRITGEPRLDRILRLQLRGHGRGAFHGSWAGQSRDGFLRGKLAALPNLAFEIRVSVGFPGNIVFGHHLPRLAGRIMEAR